MKTKFYVLAALLMASMVNVMADETCDRVYGDDQWNTNQAITSDKDNTLFIGKGNFSSAVVGNAIKIYGFDGEGDHTKIYLYGWDQILPGSDYRNPSNVEVNHVLFYLTEDMLSTIRSQDLRVFGEGITVNRVEICDGKAGALKFGKTIWTGYYYMDNGWAMELFKDAFTAVGGEELSKYRSIRIYHEANRSDYRMQVFTKFGADEESEEDDIKIADSNDSETSVKTSTYMDIPLTASMITNLTSKGDEYGISFFIKCENGGSPFNVTDIVLLPISPDGCDNCFYVY